MLRYHLIDEEKYIEINDLPEDYFAQYTV